MQELEEAKKRDKEDHDVTLKNAHDALTQADEKLALGKERLENALKRYRERAKLNGASKSI